MIYLYKKTNSPKYGVKIFVIVLLIVFFVLMRFTGFGGIVGSLLLPVFSIGDRMYGSVEGLSENTWSRDRLLQEVRTLREKENELSLKLTDISALQFENRELREALRIKPEDNFLSAYVIARPPQTSFDTLLINKGSTSNINVGDLVLASNSTVVGKVLEVSRYSSIVLLNSSPSVYLGANISRTEEPIEVFGFGSGNLFSKVPISTDAVIGDTVVINYGKVFSIGVIRDINTEETSGFKNIFLSLPVNISDLGIVFVSSLIDRNMGIDQSEQNDI